MTENTDVAIIEIKNKGALITVKVSEAQTFFTEKGKIDPILEGIREEAMLLVPDVSTKKGRDAIASAAYQVSTRKSAMQKHKMELSRKLKDIPKTVDANWREIEAYCDALRDEVRKPLDDFDAEQAALAEKKKAEEEAARLAAEIEAGHEMGLLMDAAFNVERDKRIADEAEAKRAHEQAIADAATAKAKAEAEQAALAVKEESMRRELAAQLAKENAEKEAARAAQALIEAEAKAAQEKIDAEQRAKEAEARAAQAVIDATAAAVAKAAAEARAKAAAEAAQLAAIEAENRKREADKKHIASIRRDVLDDLMATGIDEATARAVIGAIVKKSVRHVIITY
jgi:colicin import membrane protein